MTNTALDIGSGFGFFTKAAIENGFDVTAINPSRWENDVFEQMNGFRPIEKFIEDVELDKEFDLIIMSQVLEHLDDIDNILKKIKSLMTENGVLVIAVPNIDSFLVKLLGTRDNSCLWVPEHLNYFSKKGLMTYLNRLGFRVLRYQQISRIPYNFLSIRLGLSRCSTLREICNKTVQIIQRPILKSVDALGLGLYHNIWVSHAVRA